jgi:hypothetical protein
VNALAFRKSGVMAWKFIRYFRLNAGKRNPIISKILQKLIIYMTK